MTDKAPFILDTRRPLQDGTYPVKLSVGHGTHLYLSTGVSVEREFFVAGRVEGRKDAKRLNSILDTQRLRVNARILRLKEDGKLGGVSASHLRKLLTAPDMDDVPEEDRRKTLWKIAEMCISTKEGRTKDVYLHTLAKLRAFAGDGPLYIEDIDRVWLHAFDASIGGKVNSRGIHLRNLRAICNFALDEELTTHYPFRKFKIRTEETRKKALTLEQVRAYLAVPGPNEYRDVFVLMIYLRGINISDLAELTDADVVNGRIEYRRNKTGQLYSIRVEPEAQEIIDRWKGEGHLLAVFDRYRNPRDYNRRLREALKRMAGPDGRPIEKDCSSNWARHTWATMCAELDVPDPTISLGMGHRIAGHRTTAIYIKRDQRKVDDANRLVIDYINGNVPHLTTQDGTLKPT
jgi:integrase